MNAFRKLPKHMNSYWAKKSNYDKAILISSVAFLGFISFYIILHRVFFTPDQFYVIALIFALIIGQAKSFIWDWTPVLLLILSYEYLRGLIPKVNTHIHYHLMPRFDTFLFGKIPTVFLQQHLYTPGHLHWYDYFSVGLYLAHFVVPLIIAFIFWLTDRPYFREFVMTMIALSYLTFLTYLVFPAAPPWLASQMGIIPPITHITGIALGHYLNYVNVPSVYRFFGDNATAAVPSLHAEFPAMSALYVSKKYPKLAPLMVAYVFSLWFAVMYMGEHYFFDIVIGTLYVFIIYFVVQRTKNYWLPKLETKEELKRKAEPTIG